jgi:hypothetical protein
MDVTVVIPSILSSILMEFIIPITHNYGNHNLGHQFQIFEK